jgi:hypothetical protein
METKSVMDANSVGFKKPVSLLLALSGMARPLYSQPKVAGGLLVTS